MSLSDRRKLGGDQLSKRSLEFEHGAIAARQDIGDDLLDSRARPRVGLFLLTGQGSRLDMPGHRNSPENARATTGCL